ncbi:PREDICTED: uncharacterized protein LOC105452295 [Wasmannia auropunctata]|uniref:uncharacterized protein LOC105452295 n=1 Tax=Wasmannia auropunctata TaxID=64793 RepID=UPI0005EDD22F|nr:PREDICTED: uncharacterized protein LOC105452295 [Wasmannia auropunctata]
MSHFAPQLLTSAIVHLRDRSHNVVKCRALLDTCATANFISESIVERLDVHVTKHSVTIGAINEMNSESRGMVQVVMQSLHDDFRKPLTCLTVPAITDLVPSEIFPRNLFKIPPNIRLADPDFHIPRAIDLLIGSGATLSLFSVGQINLSQRNHDLYLQKTRLGWVVAGSPSAPLPSRSATCHLTSLEKQLVKFWEIEEITTDKPRSEEENLCEAHFLETVSRDNDGRYVVRLPFRKINNHLGNSRNVALKRLTSLERKLNANDSLKSEYARVIEEHLKLNHISLVKNPTDDGYYMPHHAVRKESSNTTKTRVVFDASAKTSEGVSLNDVLMVGPTIQSKLFAHLIRFRAYPYVLTADIEKMYCQVRVHKDDRRYQKILWRVNERIETFQFNTLVFGISSSPFLATRVLQKLADDERGMYPRAAKILESHLYVDDLLTGAGTIEEARTIRNEIIALLAKGGFTIRQWASNDERIVNDLITSALHANFTLNVDRSLKTLGVTWNARGDQICYSAHSIEITEQLTKRNVLAEIAKIFDPLGLLGPIVLYAKKIMQDVWRCKLQWDESVPQSLYTNWLEFVRQLESMGRVSFDRKLLVDDCHNIQIHGFCDASSVGYGACLYVRSSGKRGKTICRLACAKSRVAPLKTVTIPRLELCGALLLARLYREVSSASNVKPDKVVFWCDSTIVLHWLKTSPHSLKTYVANRVSEIQEITGPHAWRHVGSEDNPADAASRGQLPNAFLRNQTWFEGPSWLNKEESDWPHQITQSIDIPELKKNICLVTTYTDLGILERISSYSRLLRVVAHCLRWRPDNKCTGTLKATEINAAEIRILRILQSTQFLNEIKALTENKDLPNKSKIANLNPFIDENGLIRVGGRLQSSQLTFAQRHPILLPSRHHLTDCIIRETHERHYHAGIQSTLHTLRQKFWLLDGRNQVRKVVRACTRCFRFSASTVEYKMGNLPPARVREAVPFANTGIDFCGPFYIKEKKHRNRAKIKAYVCVFICMSVKAVHLELVSDLSSDGFIAALRRFSSRRGLPEHIYSDNGTNFVGANNQLKEMYQLFNSEQHQNIVNRFASEHRILWHFIPPMAPHFGGLWESTVKLFKHHVKRVVGDSLFTFEELNTFIAEVEGILNSRPITTLSSDPNDLLALTPAHYLIGKPLTALPEGNLSSVPANRLSTWQHITKVRQDFWSRWHLEYLNELQIRSKWVKDGPELEVGMIVLIKTKGLPCTQWALGRITDLRRGEDGVSRVAILKTANGELKRATRLLCPLPVEQGHKTPETQS